MKEEKAKAGRYIYGIIKHSGTVDFGPIGIGKRGDYVYGINYKNLCAIVSNTPVIQYEARRANLTAHEIVLEEVMKQFSVLPARFSTIADTDNDSGVLKILKSNYDSLVETLDRLEGKKELGLKVVAVEKAIFEHILEKYTEIRDLKEKLIHLSPDKTYYQRMKIGEMVDSALQKEKEFLKKSVLELLIPLSVDKKINDNYGNLMILNAAFLINNKTEPEFDKKVNELYEKYGEIMTFKYIGTLPPYNFVNMAINIEKN